MLDKNILFVAYFYPPVSSGGIPAIQRAIRFIRYLNISSFHVLTVKPNCYPTYLGLDSKIQLPVKNEIIHRTGTIDLNNFLLKIRSSIAKSPKAVMKNEPNYGQKETNSKDVKRVSFNTKVKEIISKILNYPDFACPWLIPAVYKGLKVIQKHKIDFIFSTGQPWTSLIIGYALKLITGKKLIVDFRDPWVGNPYIEKGKIERNLDRICETLIIQKSDIIIANTDSLKEQMEKRYPKFRKKITVVPNGYDVNDFDNIPEIRLPKDKLLISHAGFLYLKRDPISLLKAFEIMKEDHPDSLSAIQFYQIGKVDLDYDLEAHIRERGILENVIFKGNLDHKECLGYLAASDILLLIQPGTKSQIPSKLYEYIYLEKPVLAITERDGALGQMISKYCFGEVFEPTEYQEIANFLYVSEKKKRNSDAVKVVYSNKTIFDAHNIVLEFESIIEEFGH